MIKAKLRGFDAYMQTDEAVLSDMKMRAFRVGSRQDDGSFALEGDFAEYPVALDDMSVSAVQKAAATLENYAVVDKLAPAARGVRTAKERQSLKA